MRLQKWTALMLGAFLLVAWTSTLSAQDWAGRGRVQGIVTGPDKKPVKDAKVTLYLDEEGRGPEPTTTNKKGRWSMLGLATGNWTVRIEAEGFRIAEGPAKIIAAGVGPGETLRTQLNPITAEEIQAAQEEEGPGPNRLVEEANALMLETQYAEARAKYMEAIGMIEDTTIHPPILMGVARTYYAEENKEEAMNTLKEILVVDPVNQDALKLLATFLLAEGREDEAQTYIDQITDPEYKPDPNSLLNLGIQAFNAGDMVKAQSYFDRVVADNGDLPDAYYYRALVYLNQGETEKAKADFQKVIELDPNHPKAAESQEFIDAL